MKHLIALIIIITVNIPIAWNHDEPETVKYYNIYLSNTSGVFGHPYARTTKLPTDSDPLILKLPVVTGSVTKYIRVKAVNEAGESDWSNEKEVQMKFIVNDTQ